MTTDEQRRAEAVDRAAQDWMIANGRYGDARVNNTIHRAFVAGYDHAGENVARLEREIRGMERDFRDQMQVLQSEKREVERRLADLEHDRERTNWL